METIKPISGGTFFFRILGGIIGGVAGTIVMLIVQVVSLIVVPPPEAGFTGITSFALIAMLLLATLTANMTSVYTIALSDREKYQHKPAIVTHIFVLNLILFIFTTPVYLVVPQEYLNIIAGFHLLISAQMSALILEIFVGGEYALIGAYGVAFGGILSYSIFSLLLLSVGTTSSGMATLLLFIAMPLVWGILEFCLCIAEIVFHTVYKKLYVPKN